MKSIPTFEETNGEHELHKNGKYIYLLKEDADCSVVDVFLESDECTGMTFVATLSYFLEEDIPLIDYAVVSPEHRNKGIMTELYKFMVELYGVLASDTQISFHAEKIWKKLGKIYTLTDEALYGDMAITRYVLRK